MILAQVATGVMSCSVIQNSIYFFFLFPRDSIMFVVWVCEFCPTSWKAQEKFNIRMIYMG